MLRTIKKTFTKDIFFSCFSSLLLIYSFFRFSIWPLAWFAFVPLFLAAENKSPKARFFIFYFSGTIFWFGTVYWLAHITLLGLIVLVLYLSLYFGIFGLFLGRGLKFRIFGIIIIPCLWVVLEYLRSHLLTGFPWALLAYSQYRNLPLIQISDIFGCWGVSFLIMMVNVGIYFALRRRPGYLFSFFCIIAALVYGMVLISKVNKVPDKAGKIKISLLQGNIAQELKWNKESDQFIFERYLSLNNAASKDSPALIIWPEASLPVILEEEPEYFDAVKELAKKNNTSLLIGAVTLRGNDYYNSALLVSDKGVQLERYDKIHLVPFGEYIPLKKVFPFLATVVPIGDIAAGKDYTIFTLGKNKFSVLICFEDLFPELSRAFRKRGAEFLVNITNDGWYKYSTAPYQHLQASVFRAVENRVPLARAANTGISAFIYPDGRIISRIKDLNGKDIFVTGFDTKGINILPVKPTFYTRFGDIFVLACLIVILCSMMPLFSRKD